MNHARWFAAYSAFHLPVHLPELAWIIDQNKDRLKGSKTQSVLDLGCGPGTLSLSYLLSGQRTLKAESPESLYLVDSSKTALTGAEKLLKAVAGPKTKITCRRDNLKDVHILRKLPSADIILVGHLLNEWGSGPKFRERKLEFVSTLIEQKLNPGGFCVVIEPPLREPTVDLMSLRDELKEHVVAPCPSGVEQCPLLLKKLGWCYAQPSRLWASQRELAPWDNDLRFALNIKLEAPGFSYMIFRSPQSASPKAGKHTIATTDEHAPRSLYCTRSGLRDGVRNREGRGRYMQPKETSILPE
jgi:ribosomal protein RSM22 (predicted rRNA methylase)